MNRNKKFPNKKLTVFEEVEESQYLLIHMDGGVTSDVVPIFSMPSFIDGICLVPEDLAASLLIFLTPIRCSFFSDISVSEGDFGDELEIADDEETATNENESFEPSFSSLVYRGTSFASLTGSSALIVGSEAAFG